MPTIRLDGSTTRSTLRDNHEFINSCEGVPVVFDLGEDLVSLTPGQFSAWMQLILTWGQDTEDRVLQLTPEALGRIEGGGALSDIEVLAVFLAQRVRVGEVDVTDRVGPLVRDVLVERDRLTRHTGDGDPETSSLLLAAHTFTNRTSPDLHALWDGQLAVEETARTLFHDVWSSPTAPTDLRLPLLELGEVARPVSAPTHVTRVVRPDSGPDDAHGAFRSLGARAPRIRGLAHDLATEIRTQPKPLHDEIGEILFELIQNTEWHATRWAGGRTGANCRVFTLREYRFSPEQLTAAEGFDPTFVAYARAAVQTAQIRSKRAISEVRFGSATVIDSGLGLSRSVAMSLGEDHLFGPDTEIQYLIAALSKNIKRRRADQGNIGLARVQQSLTNISGFMSVRTGTVEILRDFVSKPFEPLLGHPRQAPPSLFLDWVPPREEDFVVGPRVGTAISVVYPVDFVVAT